LTKGNKNKKNCEGISKCLEGWGFRSRLGVLRGGQAVQIERRRERKFYAASLPLKFEERRHQLVM